MTMSAVVKDVMTTHVVAVRQNASFKDMAVRLPEHRVSAFPVRDRLTYPPAERPVSPGPLF
jgi:CBS-domain-containing membrane protein